MDFELILSLMFAGSLLGIVEGIKPGPLLTMVVKETLSGGLKAGLWTAAAPIFTDGPLIVLSLFAAAWIATNAPLLIAITCAGSIFLAYMGMECFSMEAPHINEDSVLIRRSFSRGIITNLLNPNVYVFWFLIGGPLMATAMKRDVFAPIAYALSFLMTIIITKATIAYFISKSAGRITSTSYKKLLAFCGIVMLGFSLFYAYSAVTLISSL